MRIVLLLAALLIIAASAYANEEGTFGHELEFGSDEIDEAWAKQKDKDDTANPVSRRIRDEFRDLVVANCDVCKVTELKDRYKETKYRITYPNGLYWDLSTDIALIEPVLGPATIAQRKSIQEELQRDIYGNAAILGLKINRDFPAAHFNIGFESNFASDVMLLRNFAVDTFNNTPIFRHVVGYEDYTNAPMLDDLLKSQQAAFADAVDLVDTGKITDPLEWSRHLVDKVFFRATFKANPRIDPPAKMQGMNFLPTLDENPAARRLELRFARMPANMRQAIRQEELLAGRLNYIRKLKKPIPFEPDVYARVPLMKLYYRYVDTAGLGWVKFQSLVPRRLGSALDRFNSVEGLPHPFLCDRAFGMAP